MRIVDLSVPIYSGMDAYPDDPEVSIEIVHNYCNKPWLLRRLVLGTHTGTHVDALSHMVLQGKTLDEIPLENFCGEACLIDEDRLLPVRIGLLFRRDTDITWLAKILFAKPPFVGGSISEDLQRALLEAGIVTYTNLVNLDQLPTQNSFIFYGLPLKIKDGDGSPVRAVAIIKDQDDLKPL